VKKGDVFVDADYDDEVSNSALQNQGEFLRTQYTQLFPHISRVV
jgi:hypothetical protein